MYEERVSLTLHTQKERQWGRKDRITERLLKLKVGIKVRVTRVVYCKGHFWRTLVNYKTVFIFNMVIVVF